MAQPCVVGHSANPSMNGGGGCARLLQPHALNDRRQDRLANVGLPRRCELDAPAPQGQSDGSELTSARQFGPKFPLGVPHTLTSIFFDMGPQNLKTLHCHWRCSSVEQRRRALFYRLRHRFNNLYFCTSFTPEPKTPKLAKIQLQNYGAKDMVHNNAIALVFAT